MVTSRTGTGKYIRNRRHVLNKARKAGLLHCPSCGCLLNWDQPRQPNSVEADHIIPHAQGGTDNTNNLTPLCRTCNITKSDGTKTKRPPTNPNHYPTSQTW